MQQDLKARLREVEGTKPDALGISTNWHRNPDGPEAADRIEALEAQLAIAREGLEAIKVVTATDYRDKVVRMYDVADYTLAKLNGDTP